MNMPPMNPQMMVNMMIRQNPKLGPIWKQAQQMANGKSPQDIETMIKNTAQTQGINLEEAWGFFTKTFGLNTNVKPF